MPTRPDKVDDFTQLITLLFGEEYNTLEHNVSSSEQAQLLSLYNRLYNKNYQDLEKYTPQSEFTDKIYTRIWLAAVQKNSLALWFVPKSEKGKKIYLSAVQEDSLALKLVPEEMKSSIINNITPELILSNNYFSKYYFPSTYNIENILNVFLKKIEHVIVTENYIGKEEKTSFLFYGKKQKRLGKTIHTGTDSLDQLFNDLMKVNKKDINLVLMGHTYEESDTIADLSIEDIISLLEKYDIINRVTLFGCHTAKSNQLNSEKERLDEFYKSDEERSKKIHGLVLATASFFKETSLTKLLGGADVVYVIKILDSGEYGLTSVEKGSDGNIEKKDIKSLDKEDVIALQSLVKGAREKGFAELLSEKKQCSLRLRTKDHSLNPDELDVISSIIEHPKKAYPFYNSATIDEKEIGKLKPSLLEKLATAIKNKIGREIIVKGYTKAIHVDEKGGIDKKGGFHVGTHLYSKGHVSIDPYKLNQYRRGMMHNLRSLNKSKNTTNEPENTTAKSIKVSISRK